MKPELTKEQIESAAKVLYELACPPYRWEAAPEATKEKWCKFAITAAPHLQLPWQGPTFEEAKAAYNIAQNDAYSIVRVAIESFVNARNALLLSAPRREELRKKIAAALDNRDPVERLIDLCMEKK